MKRRDFLHHSTLGAAGIAFTGAASAAEPEPLKPAHVQYRELGRTGLKVSAVSFGAKQVDHPSLLMAAFDAGINYFDTARLYGEGRNEQVIGEFLKTRRDKVYLATKAYPSCKSAQDVEECLHASLKSLQTDYVDIYQIHRVHTLEHLKNEDIRSFLLKVRDQGKIRFMGITMHKNSAEVLSAAAEDGFFDTALVAYGYKNRDDQPLIEAIEKAHRAGMGIIAMKTQQGGYKMKEGEPGTPHQALLRYALSNPNISCAIPGMNTFEMIEQNTAVMGTKLSSADLRDLQRYEQQTASVFCRMCGMCNGTCRNGLAISETFRCLMYAEGYNDLRMARAEYQSLMPSERADLCRLCSECTAKCVKGLRIHERMLVADRLLSA